MKKILSISLLAILISVTCVQNNTVEAQVQTPITRSQAEQRALMMIDLLWTYNKNTNSDIDPAYVDKVTQPNQLNGITSAQLRGIPYCWGGSDSINTKSFNEPWDNFTDAISKGAHAGNVNSTGQIGHVPGTAGLDCSGFIQDTFNIKGVKLSTRTLFDEYFTQISLSEIKHMDVLNRPGSHAVVFDRWGYKGSLYGAFTYESTVDQYHGGIQGAKRYFLSMNTLNKGYIPGRYKYIVDDIPMTPPPTATPPPSVVTPPPIPAGTYGKVTNVTEYANMRSSPSTTSTIIATIPKGSIVYIEQNSPGWYYVSYKGLKGWIWGPIVTAIPRDRYVTVNGVAQLNIRNLPSSTGIIIGTLGVEQYAEVISKTPDGSWYEIDTGKVRGWAYSRYLKYIY